MATIERLIHSFLAINGTGKIQSAHDVPMASNLIDTQLKATITRETIISRDRVLDCNSRYLDQKVKNTQMYRYTLVFTAVKPQIMALFYSLFAGAVLSPTGSPANEVQTLTRTGTVSGGTFTIAITFEGKTYTSGSIAWNASTAVIQAAIIRTPGLGNFVKSGDVAVSGDWTAGMVLTFGGRLAHANLPSVIINAASLTGTTPGISVAQTTAGANNYHAISTSTTDEKAEFSFVLGHKTSSILPQEFYNAVVERFEPSLPRGGDVGLTVAILCNYEPVQLDNTYTIPACNNYLPLKTKDCSFEADSEWKTREISALNIALNDSVPVDADTYGFDSLDPELLERGDQPTNSFNGSVYGNPADPSDNFAQDVRDEETIPAQVNFGLPGERFSLIVANLVLNPATNDRAYAGSRNRSTVSFEGEGARNGSAAPIAAEYTGGQSTAFLTT